MNEILLYIGSGLVIIWGVAHLFPTTAVINGFGDISRDNRLIITMEWIAEGITMCFIGVLVILVTAFGGYEDSVSIIVYRASAAMLVAIGILTALTAARGSGTESTVLPYRICPFLVTTVAVLFILGSLV